MKKLYVYAIVDGEKRLEAICPNAEQAEEIGRRIIEVGYSDRYLIEERAGR